MAQEEIKNSIQEVTDPTQFRKNRVKDLNDLYSDDASTSRRLNRTPVYKSGDYKTAKAIRDALLSEYSNPTNLVELSKKLYAVNPIYASVINYLSDMFLWRYKVTPHKVYSKSKAKLKKTPKEDDFKLIYNLMLEVADGLSIETKFPAMLNLLYITGAVYFTTLCDEESITIDTLLLPNKYCRKIGETQFGTPIIEFDFSYFTNLGLTDEQAKDYFKSFPKEFLKHYNAYKKDNSLRWAELDPHFSSGLLLNEMGVPTFLYLYGGILNFEQYQDNELERNENKLKYIVVQTMPHYEDKLLFEVDEVKALHNSMKKIIDKGNKVRLVTTFGDIHVDKVSDNDATENEVLNKAFNAIFNNAGLNNTLFTGNSVEALKISLVRDKGMVWNHVQHLLNFYTIAINNWFDFKEYEADIDILPISPYTYNDDIKIYKENATLGVDKLGYIIATGIKQKNIADQLFLEDFLKLEDIVPMQTSYTQTEKDRNGTVDKKTEKDGSSNSSKEKSESENEPSDKEKEVDDDSKTSDKSE